VLGRGVLTNRVASRPPLGKISRLTDENEWHRGNEQSPTRTTAQGNDYQTTERRYGRRRQRHEACVVRLKSWLSARPTTNGRPIDISTTETKDDSGCRERERRNHKHYGWPTWIRLRNGIIAKMRRVGIFTHA
jgi:hypothetical protein